MKSLYESILGKSTDKVGNIHSTLKDAELELKGFPSFNDKIEDEGWVWYCPDLIEQYIGELYKEGLPKKKWTGLFFEVTPTEIMTGARANNISVMLMQDTTRNYPWHKAHDIFWVIGDRDERKVYEWLKKFCLNINDVMKDCVKYYRFPEGYDVSDAVRLYKEIDKRYKK
jgi:hypothetical protein